jgi:hypothetical protein
LIVVIDEEMPCSGRERVTSRLSRLTVAMRLAVGVRDVYPGVAVVWALTGVQYHDSETCFREKLCSPTPGRS